MSHPCSSAPVTFRQKTPEQNPPPDVQMKRRAQHWRRVCYTPYLHHHHHPNPTLNPVWLAAQWGRWKECMCVVCVCVCLSVRTCVCLRGFWCVIPEAPLTPSQVFPLSQTRFFFFLLFIFFSNHRILESVCFHIANHSIPQTWWNLCFRLFKGYFFLLFFFFFDTVSPLYFRTSSEYYVRGCAESR